MITCRRATRWMLDALDRKLPWFRRIMLGLHRCQCRSCHRFGQQIVVIEQSFAEFADSDPAQVQELSLDCRRRIDEYLRNHCRP
jgi:hypothetical protein